MRRHNKVPLIKRSTMIMARDLDMREIHLELSAKGKISMED